MIKMARQIDKNNADHVPVLIVGAGPVGLVLAAELGWRGVRCQVVEQGDGVIEHPKTQNINMRTMEFYRRWGIAQEVRDKGFPRDYPQDIHYVTSLTGYLLARQSYPSYAELKTPPDVLEMQQRCSQTILDPILRKLAESFPTVTLRYRTRCVGVEQNADMVTARLLDVENGTEERMRADYVVSCEGAASLIREALGITLEGTDVLSYSTNILFRSTELPAMHDKGAGFYVLMSPEGRWATLNAINGKDLWRLQVRGSKDPKFWDDFDADAAIKRMAGQDFDYEILSSLSWVRAQLVANRYCQGRVFLAGDSAHQLTPSGGFGMNTGMGDAVDLAWKLDAVLAGWGGARLLETYEIERRPIGERNVNEAAAKFFREGGKGAVPGPALLETSPEGDRVRKKVTARLEKAMARDNVGSDLGPRYETAGIQLGYVYESSPIVIADGTPAMVDPKHYVPSARPGGRAPHVWIEDGKSILDLFGGGFVLLRLGADAPAVDGLVGAAAAAGLPLQVVSLDIPALTALYERKLVLVRPDGHVAWRADLTPEKATEIIGRVRGAGALAKAEDHQAA